MKGQGADSGSPGGFRANSFPIPSQFVLKSEPSTKCSGWPRQIRSGACLRPNRSRTETCGIQFRGLKPTAIIDSAPTGPADSSAHSAIKPQSAAPLPGKCPGAKPDFPTFRLSTLRRFTLVLRMPDFPIGTWPFLLGPSEKKAGCRPWSHDFFTGQTIS